MRSILFYQLSLVINYCEWSSQQLIHVNELRELIAPIKPHTWWEPINGWRWWCVQKESGRWPHRGLAIFNQVYLSYQLQLQRGCMLLINTKVIRFARHVLNRHMRFPVKQTIKYIVSWWLVFGMFHLSRVFKLAILYLKREARGSFNWQRMDIPCCCQHSWSKFYSLHTEEPMRWKYLKTLLLYIQEINLR